MATIKIAIRGESVNYSTTVFCASECNFALSCLRRAKASDSAVTAQAGHGRELGLSGSFNQERTARTEQGRWVCSQIKAALSACVSRLSASRCWNASLFPFTDGNLFDVHFYVTVRRHLHDGPDAKADTLADRTLKLVKVAKFIPSQRST